MLAGKAQGADAQVKKKSGKKQGRGKKRSLHN